MRQTLVSRLYPVAFQQGGLEPGIHRVGGGTHHPADQ